jgi:transposase
MTKLLQFADLSNKHIFVGIDVHKKNWSVSLYYESEYLRTFNQPPAVEVIEKLLRRDYPGAEYICGYESGFCGFWIQRQFTQRGIMCKVLHAADIPKAQKHKISKTDFIDSQSIAQALSAGTVNSIYIPDPELESSRSLIRQRERVIRDIKRCKNRIRSLLFQYGYVVPDCLENAWSNKFIQWLEVFDIEQPVVRKTLNHMIEQLQLLRGSFLRVNKDIRQLQKAERYKALMDRLLSIPGVGPLTAITLITEIGDINRFSSFRRLNSFVGLYPMEYSSGEHEYKGKITIRQNKYLRKLLIEASWAAIRHDPALLLAFNHWKSRMTPKRAIVKVARKLLSRINYIWINKTSYVKNVVK